jgi:KRI1-like family C-terminal/KRI1-like family
LQVDYRALAAAFADELDTEWDPDAYDKKMQQLFGEEYYGHGDEDLEAQLIELAKKDKKSGKGKGGGDANAAWSLDDDDDDEDDEDDEDAAPEDLLDRGDDGSDSDSSTSSSSSGSSSSTSSSSDSNKKKKGANGKAAATASSGASKLPAWVFGDGKRPSWAGPSAEELARGVDGFEGIFKGKKAPGANDTLAADAPEEDAEQDGEDEEEEEELDPAVVGYGVASKRNRHHKRKKRTAVANGRGMTAVQRAKAMIAAENGKKVLEEDDEVLALGFEDVIGGGAIKTRMKYKPVPASDFGLTPEEILLLDDSDLNKYVGLKRLAPYREQEWKVPEYLQKKAIKDLRKKVKKELKKNNLLAPAGGEEGGASSASAAAAETAEEEAARLKAEKKKGCFRRWRC